MLGNYFEFYFMSYIHIQQPPGAFSSELQPFETLTFSPTAVRRRGVRVGCGGC